MDAFIIAIMATHLQHLALSRTCLANKKNRECVSFNRVTRRMFYNIMQHGIMGTWTLPCYILYWCINNNTRRPYPMLFGCSWYATTGARHTLLLQMHWHQAATIAATIQWHVFMNTMPTTQADRGETTRSLLVSDRFIFSQVDGILQKRALPRYPRVMPYAITSQVVSGQHTNTHTHTMWYDLIWCHPVNISGNYRS